MHGRRLRVSPRLSSGDRAAVASDVALRAATASSIRSRWAGGVDLAPDHLSGHRQHERTELRTSTSSTARWRASAISASAARDQAVVLLLASRLGLSGHAVRPIVLAWATISRAC